MEPIPLSQLIAVAIAVCVVFEGASVYFLMIARRAASQDKRFFSDARLGNLVLSFFFALVGVLFLIFYVRNNSRPFL